MQQKNQTRLNANLESVARYYEAIGKQIGSSVEYEKEKAVETQTRARHAKYRRTYRKYMEGLGERQERIEQAESDARKATETLRSRRERDLKLESAKSETTTEIQCFAVSDLTVPNENVVASLVNEYSRAELRFQAISSFGVMEDPICGACGQAMRKVSLCSKGHLTCVECSSKCLGCPRTYCRGCNTKMRCSICGNTACEQHFYECPICLSHNCNSHIGRCGSCYQAYCTREITNGTCKTCNGLTKAVGEQSNFIIALTRLRELDPSTRRMGSWKFGENRDFVILRSRGLIRHRTFVLAKNQGRPVYASS